MIRLHLYLCFWQMLHFGADRLCEDFLGFFNETFCYFFLNRPVRMWSTASYNPTCSEKPSAVNVLMVEYGICITVDWSQKFTHHKLNLFKPSKWQLKIIIIISFFKQKNVSVGSVPRNKKEVISLLIFPVMCVLILS